MCTERQRLANQENARKSTGPRTAAGKENSRRNALQHGLTGSGKVLTRTDARKLQKALKAWREHLQPIDVLEDCLVSRAALASVRLKRCLKKDLAEVERRKRRATSRWDARQEKAVDQCVELLISDPEHALAQLEVCSAECEWLVERWKELAAALEEPGFWDDDQANRAIRMRGKNPVTALMGDSSLTKLRLAVLAASPEADPDDVDAFLEESTAELDPEARRAALAGRLPDHETARAMLLDIVEQELARLEPLRAQLWEEQDGPARQEAEDISLVDTSLSGARSLRYESAHEMSVHRSVNLLIRLRKVESEQQTYDRFSKMGIDQGRYWDGKNWIFLRDEAKAQQREEAERRDYEKIASAASSGRDLLGPENPEQPSAQQRYEAHVRQEAERQAAREADSGRSQGTSGVDPTFETLVRDEANSSDANQSTETVCDDSVSRSPIENGKATVCGRVVGSEVGRPVRAETQSGEQALPHGVLPNEAIFSEANQRAKTVCDAYVPGSRNGDGLNSEAAKPRE